MTSAASKVFISYAHESEELANTVLELSNELRSVGVDCEIDQYEEAPPEGWPKWMVRQVQDAKYVLVMCSQLFSERANDFSGKEEGLGAKWETSLILQQLYLSNTNNTKFIPIVVGRNGTRFIPLPLQPYTYYDINDKISREKLFNRLRGVSSSKRPELGQPSQPTALPSKERKSLFVTGVINVELWNQARWKAMAFLSAPDLSSPPVIGFVFENNAKGEEIFSELRRRFGESDVAEEIRISFIEKISDDRTQDYKVHVGTNWEAFTPKLEEAKLNPDEALVMSISRIHEMNPPKDSRNLEVFKHSYAYFKEYYITNFELTERGLAPNFSNMIKKRKIFFRTKSEVITERNDPDSVVFANRFSS